MRFSYSRLRIALAAAFIASAAPVLAVPMGTAAVAASPAEQVQFEVLLPLQHQDSLASLLVALHDQNSPQYRQWLTPEQFKAQFGASPASIARITAALQARGLSVVATHTSSLTVTGPAAAASALINAHLVHVTNAAGKSHVRAASIMTLPAELTNEGAHIVAFSSIPEHHLHSKVAVPANRYSTTGSYWFDDLKQAYDFPSYQTYTGKGRTIAIVMSSDYSPADMTGYFGHEKLAVPKIIHIPIDGGSGPFDPNTNDAAYEVSLDLQQSGGMAPNATLKLYDIPDLSDQSIMDAYTSIIENNSADIVSSSFGGAEAFYLASYNDGEDFTYVLQQYEQMFQQGNAQGITFVASSGDNGGLGVPPVGYFFNAPTTPPTSYNWLPGIESPASSPSVTAVGGTNLITTNKTNSLESKYVSENAFGDPLIAYDPYGTGNLLANGYWGSGGGASVVFSKPLYQRLVNTQSKMRTTPDISMQEGGCPAGITAGTCDFASRSSVVAEVGGQLVGLIGTSASAPEIAGTLAVYEERLGGVRLGNANNLFYAQAALQSIFPFLGYYHTGIQGFNGAEYTAPVYSQVLGVGTPDVRNLILAPLAPAAGNPQTPSNP